MHGLLHPVWCLHLCLCLTFLIILPPQTSTWWTHSTVRGKSFHGSCSEKSRKKKASCSILIFFPRLSWMHPHQYMKPVFFGNCWEKSRKIKQDFLFLSLFSCHNIMFGYLTYLKNTYKINVQTIQIIFFNILKGTFQKLLFLIVSIHFASAIKFFPLRKLLSAKAPLFYSSVTSFCYTVRT